MSSWDDNLSSKSEGYSSTYSESSGWSYDSSSDYSSYYNRNNDYNYRNNRDFYSERAREPQWYDKYILGVIGTLFGGVVTYAGCMIACMECQRAKERAERRRKAIANLMESVDETVSPEPGHHKAIFCTAELDLKGSVLTDEFFGVQVVDKVLLRRQVEVYCYREDISKREERRGNQKRTITDYNYTTCWMEARGMPNSQNFKDKKYNLNKPSSVDSQSFFINKNASIGNVIKVRPNEFSRMDSIGLLQKE